jgi:GTPase SAR1 family protein
MAEGIGAHSFFECSALKREGIEELFEDAVRASLVKVKSRRRTLCVIL